MKAKSLKVRSASRTPWRKLRYLALPVIAVALVTGLDWNSAQISPPSASAADWPQSGYGPQTYAQALARTSEQIELGEERVKFGRSQWLRQESLARGLLDRSRLSYTYDELARANIVLAHAQDLAPANTGPLFSVAGLAMMVHRLDEAEAALDMIDSWAVRPNQADLAEISGLRGDIAFYRGDFSGAERYYANTSDGAPAVGSSYRLAQLAKARGEFDLAITHFKNAEGQAAKLTPFAHASTAMQIGAVELARGNYTAARDWFAVADRQFSGFWLFEAQLAQAKALDGDLTGAIADMRQIAERAPSADVMDALAVLLRANGEAAESRDWALRAGDQWALRLEQLPKAAYGHAVEHELMFGSTKRALELARLNLAARPYGQSRILLASALFANGQMDGALAQLAEAERSGWRSAQLYALRAQLLEISDERDAAEQARARALALNPAIFDAISSLVWFSHG